MDSLPRSLLLLIALSHKPSSKKSFDVLLSEFQTCGKNSSKCITQEQCQNRQSLFVA